MKVSEMIEKSCVFFFSFSAPMQLLYASAKASHGGDFQTQLEGWKSFYSCTLALKQTTDTN